MGRLALMLQIQEWHQVLSDLNRHLFRGRTLPQNPNLQQILVPSLVFLRRLPILKRMERWFDPQNLLQSYKYRPMDAYLIDPDRWKRERPELLERAGLAEFADPEPVLATLQKALTQQYQRTNANAAANPHLKIRADGTFHIATPAAGADGPGPTNELFPQRHDVPLAQMLETINNHYGMLGSFEHW